MLVLPARRFASAVYSVALCPTVLMAYLGDAGRPVGYMASLLKIKKKLKSNYFDFICLKPSSFIRKISRNCCKSTFLIKSINNEILHNIYNVFSRLLRSLYYRLSPFWYRLYCILHAPESVRPSVCLSQVGVLSKRLNIGSRK